MAMNTFQHRIAIFTWCLGSAVLVPRQWEIAFQELNCESSASFASIDGVGLASQAGRR
jgi:hypothetical protein